MVSGRKVSAGRVAVCCGRNVTLLLIPFFFFSSRRRHTRYWRDWSSDVCSSDLVGLEGDSKSGMSATLGDVLNRGRLDAFVTNISVRGYLFQGNNLRLNFLPELGRFEQGAEGVVTDAGWAWGAQLGDLDNDGRNELFIVNGYVSADRERSYWYAMSKIAGANGNVFEDARSWPAIGKASLSGYERSRVLVNHGLQGWTDVAALVGVTDE